MQEKEVIKRRNTQKYIKIAFIVFMFFLYLTWAYVQPYNAGPDEGMKFDVSKYILENVKLPHGGEESIRNPLWGISYAFTPILSYIIAAVFMWLGSLFTTNAHILIVIARLSSILFMTGYVVVCMKIAEQLFEKLKYQWLFITFCSLLPQVVFLGTYLNNDSIALFAIALIVYSWLIGIKTKWGKRSIVTLGIGVAVCTLSYYNAYGYILCSILLFIFSALFQKIKLKEIIKKGCIISAIVFLLAGWWFIRNAIIYNGDFLGMNTQSEYAEKYAKEEYKPSKIKNPDHQRLSKRQFLIEKGWIQSTYLSFIGLFGYMKIIYSMKIYLVFSGIFIIALIGLFLKCISHRFFIKDIKNKENRNKIVLYTCFILSILIPIGLSLYYSYFSDFQPQGRYIMPMIIPFMFFITIGIKELLEKIIKNEKMKTIITGIVIAFWTIIPIYTIVFYIIPYYNK